VNPDCICGHPYRVHLMRMTGECVHLGHDCGCMQYTPDDGSDGDTRYPGPSWKSDPYNGFYQRPGGYRLDEETA
jgi:hypothetical protein